MAQLIERLTIPGDIVLDPFLGGATTGVVAVDLKRRFIGVETDAKVLEVAKSWLSEVRP